VFQPGGFLFDERLDALETSARLGVRGQHRHGGGAIHRIGGQQIFRIPHRPDGSQRGFRALLVHEHAAKNEAHFLGFLASAAGLIARPEKGRFADPKSKRGDDLAVLGDRRGLRRGLLARAIFAEAEQTLGRDAQAQVAGASIGAKDGFQFGGGRHRAWVEGWRAAPVHRVRAADKIG